MAKTNKNQSELTKENVYKSEKSSSLYKVNSEFGTTFGDSAYGSLGHSAHGSHIPNNLKFGKFEKMKQDPSSKSSGKNGYKSQLQATSIEANAFIKDKQNDPHGYGVRDKKRTISRSLKQKLSALQEEGRNEKTEDTKSENIATLSHALGFVDKFRKLQTSKKEAFNEGDEGDEINKLVTNIIDVCKGSKVKLPSRDSYEDQENVQANITECSNKKQEGGFCVAVSLHDGMVMQTTPTLSDILGYPKDMWIGRSFMDFVHPKDKAIFIAQVTENVNLDNKEISEGENLPQGKNISHKSDNFFARIRMYNGLKSGFSVRERKTKYVSFKMCVCFSEISDPILGLSNCLFITAIPLQSAYTTPNEEGPITPNSGQEWFTSKNSVDCIFTVLDENSVPFLGYFPQDLQGTEIFGYIHPDDLPVIKESFENIKFGKTFKSQPYRLKTRNGDFVTVITVWSCFINPWSQLLEFISGKHTVIKGPANPNVFMESLEDSERMINVEDKITKEDLLIQEDIKNIIKKISGGNKAYEELAGNKFVSKKELFGFMGTLLQEFTQTETVELNPGAISGKVVIGSISPHRSNSSTSPPSYTQLAYNENLSRFFNSQPKTLSEKNMPTGFPYSTTSYEENIKVPVDIKSKKSKSRQSKKESGARLVEDGGSGHGSGDQQGSGTGQTMYGSGEDARNSSFIQVGLSASHINPGVDEWKSQDGCTSGSGSRLGSGSREGIDDTYTAPPLTKELMVIHNQDMEIKMLTEFKEAKRIRKVGGTHNQANESDSSSTLVLKNEEKLKEEKETFPTFLSNHENTSKSIHSLSNKCQQIKQVFNDEQRCSYSGGNTLYATKDPSQFQGNMIPYQACSTVQGLAPHENYNKHMKIADFDISALQPEIVQASIPIDLPTGSKPIKGIPIDKFKKIDRETKDSDQKRISKPFLYGESQVEEHDLLNCLAVNSFLVFSEQQESAILNDHGKKIIASNKSMNGSQRTSIKGETGSALESNSSDGASINEGNIRPHITKEKINRPVLSEPFWNKNVLLTDALVKCYEVEEKEPMDTLNMDKEKLRHFEQPKLVEEQLKELLVELDINHRGIDHLFHEKEDSDDDTTQVDDGICYIDDSFSKIGRNLNAKFEFPMHTPMSLSYSGYEEHKFYSSTNMRMKKVDGSEKNGRFDSGVFPSSSKYTGFEIDFDNEQLTIESLSTNEETLSFSTILPQDRRFRYGSESKASDDTEISKEDEKMMSFNEDSSKCSRKSDKEKINNQNMENQQNEDEVDSVTQVTKATKINNDKKMKRSDKKIKKRHPSESSRISGVRDSRLKESTEESESSVEYLISSASADTDPHSDDQTKK